MTGQLVWNQDRPDIALDTGTLYGGLHCGECFLCWIDGQWEAVRLEYAEKWVLILNGQAIPVCYGARTQI